MPDEPAPSPDLPTNLGGLNPEELFARGMNSVRMSSAGTGNWTPPAAAELNAHFPQYEILSMLGRGGMGAVYQARQIALDRLVAIKLLPLEVSVNKNFADRFTREARAMAKLNHPNIIAVYDFGATTEGHLYFVMEFVEGANLHNIVRRGELDSEQTLSIVGQVCTALAYAHGKGVVHRDIKPANVMIDTESRVKVADFGLARLTEPGSESWGTTMTGIVMGTPDYMAPEQKRGMHVDHRADIYSLGVMLYEMLCREVPQGIFEPPSRRIGCDPRIDQIVIRAMQQAPDRRYQSTQEMKADVETARTPLAHPAPDTAAAAAAASPRPPTPPQSTAEPDPAMPVSPHPSGGIDEAVRKRIMAGLAKSVSVPHSSSHSEGVHEPVQPAPERPVPLLPPEKRERKSRPPGKSRKPLYAGMMLVLIIAGAFFFAKWKIRNAATAGPQPFVNTLGMKFVPVPGTNVLFSIWDTRVRDYSAYARANKVDDSWTRQQKDGAPISREPYYPVVAVSWDDAQAFCQWLTEKETAEKSLPKGAKYRLPTDEEWSRAVGLVSEQGATPAEKSGKDGVDYPWGIGYPPRMKAGNYADTTFHERFPKATETWTEGYTDGYATTSPVGSFPANAFGLFDMGGNVWQWCEDWIDKDKKGRVLRGGAWNNSGPVLLSSERNLNEPSLRANLYGFRCVLEPAPPAEGPAPAPAAAAGKSINLLPLVDIKRDAVKGKWSMKPEGLSLDFAADFAALELPYEPPEEYDFEVAFTPIGGGLNPNLYLHAGGSSFAWKVNAHGHTPPLYGFDMLDGKLMTSNPDACATNDLRIENGHRYTTRVEVRRDHLRGLVNDIEMMKWSGDFHRLSMEAGSKLPDERALGVGSFKRTVIFHSIQVREITGAGRIIGAAAN